MLTLAEADAELQRLAILHKNHADEQFLARRNLRLLPGDIERMSQRLHSLTADLATATAHATDPVTIGKRAVPHADAPAMLARYLESITWRVSEASRVPLGTYRGLRFGLILHPQFSPEVYLQGAATLQDTLSRDHHGPRAILNSLERLCGSYARQCDSLRKDLEIAESQLRDYKARLGVPFPHHAYFSELTALRDQLKAGLSRAPGTSEDDSQPSVSELADRIKALRAAHTIEATPERIGKRRTVPAEEPVTAASAAGFPPSLTRSPSPHRPGPWSSPSPATSPARN